MIKSTNIPEVIMGVCLAGVGKKVADCYALKDVVISHFEEASSQDVKSGPVAFLVHNFSNIEVRHTPCTQAGQSKTPYSVSYDLNAAASA